MKKTVFLLAFSIICWSLTGQNPVIRIADVMVTPANQDNIASDYISGMVSYDSSTKTLTLNNATIYQYDLSDPYSDINGKTVMLEAHHGQTMTIELIGENTIFGIEPLVLYSGSYIITGLGSLSLNGVFSGINCGLDVASVEIREGSRVEINVGVEHGVGFQGSTPYENYDLTSLTIDSSSFVVNAENCVRSLDGLHLNGCHVAEPEGSYYDHASMTVVTENGTMVKDHLYIYPGIVSLSEPEKIPFQIWGGGGGVNLNHVPDHTQVVITNILGQVVVQTIVNGGGAFLPLQQGVYVVRVRDYAVKVIVD